MQGIILAGGYSSRAGCFKVTRKILGKPVIEYCIDSMNEVCDKIIVVVGYKAESLKYLSRKYEKVSIVINENYSKGMFSSVLAGLQATTAKQIFIAPGDSPAISSNTYKAMLNKNSDILVPAFNNICGHPVLLKKETVKRINSSYSSLHDFILNHGFDTIKVNDAGILMDIDYPDDFLKIEKYFMEGIW